MYLKAQNINSNSSYSCLHNRTSNWLVFKVKDGYNRELKMPETMKLFGSTKKAIDKKKKWKKRIKLWSSWSGFSPMQFSR